MDASSMVALIQQGVTKLVKASSRKHKVFRQAAHRVTEHINKLSAEQRVADRGADKYFMPFKLACETESAKMMEIGLDYIQKLIAYGYMRGSGIVDPKVYPPRPEAAAKRKKANQSAEAAARAKHRDRRRLIDVIVETIYDCSMYENDKVQLQVIKGLLTAVTSVSCKVHAHSLLLAVRACYHIYLTSRNMNNQTTAKATLTQMLNIVFQRMEHFAAQLKEHETGTADSSHGSGGADDDEALVVIDQQEVQKEMEQAGDKADTAPAPASADTSAADDKPTANDVDADADESKTSNGADSANGASSSAPRGKFGVCIVCGSPANNFCLQTKDPVCSMECKVAHFDDVINEDPSKKKFTVKTTIAAKYALLQHDAFLIFRALCKLSMKVLPSPPEPIALASKTLSLELLLSVLDRPGPTFRQSEIFLELVRENLVMSLLQNSVSTVESVFRLSSSIFVSLIANFKPQIKVEIGVFLDNVFLKILASPNSTYAHKKMALQVFSKLCQDPQTLVEIFLNYDCDSNSSNIFQGVITQLEKISRGGMYLKDWMTEEQEASLRRLALETFGHIMKSLVVWSENARGKVQILDQGSESDDGSVPPSPSQQPATLSAPNSDRKRRNSFGSDSSDSKDDKTRTASRPAFAESFQAQKQRQKHLQTGIVKFNLKPKKGIAYLREHGIIDDTPESMANFLRTARGINKSEAGDFLGDHKDFNKQVRNAFIDAIDFVGMTFDDALRHFLSACNFRLPGEAQKIDRLMEKFADQYCNHNPGRFSSADTAYALAYSIIMLNTDLHSDQIKNKMTRQEFIRNNRGLDNGKDIPSDYLMEIYDRILHNEIKMKDEQAPAGADSSGRVAPQARFYSFLEESQKMVMETHALIKRGSGAPVSSTGKASAPQMNGVAHSAAEAPTSSGADSGGSSAGSKASAADPATADRRVASPLSPVDEYRSRRRKHIQPFYMATPADFEAVRPMFEIGWYPMLGTFSILMEETSDPRIVALVLDGYRYAVRISSVFELDEPRVAFVRSLKQCTLLGTGKEMAQKNIEAIKMLLEIAHVDGNHLKDSWGEVLSAVSEFERLHTIAGGARPKMDIFQAGSPGRARKQMSQFDLMQQMQREQRDSANSQTLMDQIEASLIDRIFTNSSNLQSEPVVDFVNHLRLVSEQELGFLPDSNELRTNAGTPRVFSLQKLVEITYYNMGRIRIVWSRIWQILSDYFIKAGCHPNLNVSMFVIDSLRQLSMKFLEKDELSNYHFQKQFLKPFEHIMARTRSVEVKELIIQCLSRMILSRVDNIKSGWKSVFVVMTHGAADSDDALVTNAFDIVERIMKQYFALITDNIEECVNCLVAFGENVDTDISLQAIEYIGQCTDYLSDEHGILKRTQLARQRSASLSRGRRPSTVAGDASAADDTKAPDSPSVGSRQSSSSQLVDAARDEDPDVHAWLLVLTGLSRMIGDHRLEVRSRALQVLFKILHTHGAKFSGPTWSSIFRRVLFPIFDQVLRAGGAVAEAAAPQSAPRGRGRGRGRRGPGRGGRGGRGRGRGRGRGGRRGSRKSVRSPSSQPIVSDGWLRTTCLAALSTLVELFAHFQTTVAFLLPELLALLNKIIDQPSEELSGIGIKCWSRLMHVSGGHFTHKEWLLVLSSLKSAFVATLPHELQSPGVRRALSLPLFERSNSVFSKNIASLLGVEYTPVDVELHPSVVEVKQSASAASIVSDAAGAPAEEKRASAPAGDTDTGAAEEAAAAGTADDATGANTDSSAPTQTGDDAAGAQTDAAGADGAADQQEDAADAKATATPSQAEVDDTKKEQDTQADTNGAQEMVPPEIEEEADADEAAQQGTEQPTATDSGALPTSASQASVASSASTTSASSSSSSSARPGRKRGPHPPSGPPPAFSQQASPHTGSGTFHRMHAEMGKEVQANAKPLLPFSAKAVITKCKGQLILMDSLYEVLMLYHKSFTRKHIDLAMESLLLSVQFARAFNFDTTLRTRLWEAGFMRDRQDTPPELFFQEAHGLKLYVMLVTRIFLHYNDNDAVPEEISMAEEDLEETDTPLVELAQSTPLFTRHDLEHVEQNLFSLSQCVVDDYVAKVRASSPEKQRSLRCMSAVVCAVLNGYMEYSEAVFLKHVPSVFALFLELIHVGSPDIRFCLSRLLARRLPALLPFEFKPIPAQGQQE